MSAQAASSAATLTTPAPWKPPVSQPTAPEVVAAGRERIAALRQAVVGAGLGGSKGCGWAHAAIEKQQSGQPVRRAVLLDACTTPRLDPASLGLGGCIERRSYQRAWRVCLIEKIAARESAVKVGKILCMYTQPYQFEPLLPSDARIAPLLTKAHDLSRLATLLLGTRVPPELRSLLRSMNSYYTNRIEGQHTRPHEIEQALWQDFSSDATLAAKQRLALAHIEAAAALELRYIGPQGALALYSVDAVQDMHRELFGRLPASDLVTPENEAIVPGKFRLRDVLVGQHVAPAHASVPRFLARWAGFYGQVRRGEAALVAMAAAHQRLGWIHPFIDGNGRVMRLHTHTLLSALGYTAGLWSPLRGFARRTPRYCLAGRRRQPAPG